MQYDPYHDHLLEQLWDNESKWKVSTDYVTAHNYRDTVAMDVTDRDG